MPTVTGSKRWTRRRCRGSLPKTARWTLVRWVGDQERTSGDRGLLSDHLGPAGQAVLHHHYIEFDDATHAHGWWWLDNWAKKDDQSLIGCGRLHDNYEQVDGKWLFKSRLLELFFMVPIGEGWAKTMK